MTETELDRRALLATAAAWGVAGAMARLATGVDEVLAQAAAPAAVAADAFSAQVVKQRAEKLAAADYIPPRIELPDPFGKLTYDQYRDIRFRADQSIWRGEKLDFELQFFPVGFLYTAPVEIALVEDGKVRTLTADGKLFSLGPLIGPGPDAAPFAFSGFRVHGPLNRSDYFDEYVVFQGASYLRAVARGQVYGMSARGLAINTAQPAGEEFPLFRAFYIEKPKPGATSIAVHALLDSPSTTGAYRFEISTGPATIMDVEMTLYPRKALAHVGIAPLTSMYLYGAAHRRVGGDFRPSVHDSEGLAILNGKGERLWRPLTNPKKLQTSAFVDKNPKGFGLSQRDRAFRNFQDLEARYEKRPTVWVEPRSAWGDGYVELIEIPTEEEIHDNVVAFWKPAKPLAPGQPHTFSYRLHWTEAVPAAWTGSRVAKTFIGPAKKAGALLFVIDFEGPAVKGVSSLPLPELSASAGTITNVVVQKNAEVEGVRVTFELQPASSEVIELRLALKAADQYISESWLYRWTKP